MEWHVVELVFASRRIVPGIFLESTCCKRERERERERQRQRQRAVGDRELWETEL
jgi:hypothetical protein